MIVRLAKPFATALGAASRGSANIIVPDLETSALSHIAQLEDRLNRRDPEDLLTQFNRSEALHESLVAAGQLLGRRPLSQAQHQNAVNAFCDGVVVATVNLTNNASHIKAALGENAQEQAASLAAKLMEITGALQAVNKRSESSDRMGIMGALSRVEGQITLFASKYDVSLGSNTGRNDGISF